MIRTVWQTTPVRRGGLCNQHAVNPAGQWYTRTRYNNGTHGKWVLFSIRGREPDRSRCVELRLEAHLPGDDQ